jgi:hypothetical protein
MDIWHVILVDSLFLLGAACLGCWFRAWRRAEGRAFDQRLNALKDQQQRLERLVEGLATAGHSSPSQTVQRTTRQSEGGKARSAFKRTAKQLVAPRPHGRPYGQTQNEEQVYSQARSLLGAGVDSGEVARNLELGIAEVEALRRVLRHEDRAAGR